MAQRRTGAALAIFVALALGPDAPADVGANGDRAVRAGGPLDGVMVQIDPPEIVLGPDDTTDNPFNTVALESRLLSYVGNAETVTLEGGSLETLQRLERLAIRGGGDRSFDSCGAWLNSALLTGGLVRGWYHAETECAYPRTHKSVAYAESADGGRTFLKPGHPANQVLRAPAHFAQPETDDEGDQHVIAVGENLHMYFVAGRDYQVRLARASVASGGGPGAWWKYRDGRFDEPGLGGESSPIDPSGQLSRSWVSYLDEMRSYVGFSYNQRSGTYRGFGLIFSVDGISDWHSLPDPILPYEGQYWERGPGSRDLVEYPSLISVYGDSARIDPVFWVYHMHVNGGEGFDRRYLVRRKLRLWPADDARPGRTGARIALARYEYGADTWDTTAAVDARYRRREILGYLFTAEQPGSLPVYDCFIAGWNDHMLTLDDATCDGATYLKRVGWIAREPMPESVRVFRCFDDTRRDHFVSQDPACGGAQMEWPLGYLATLQEIPANRFVALSRYRRDVPDDTWVTTAAVPDSHRFRERQGYLYADARPGTIPVYDCYLPREDDHMLDIDPGCGNPAVRNEGRMGWIATTEFEGAVALYRCHDDGAFDHFVSTDPGCEGKRTEWRIGFAALEPREQAGEVATATPTADATSTPAPSITASATASATRSDPTEPVPGPTTPPPPSPTETEPPEEVTGGVVLLPAAHR